MALDADGKIIYEQASTIGETRFQTDPPVCNVCRQGVTRQNYGFSCVESNYRIMQRFEFIACTACTPTRQSGEALTRFLEQHHL